MASKLAEADMVGRTFDRLTVERYVGGGRFPGTPSHPAGNLRHEVTCRCSCGVVLTVPFKSLTKKSYPVTSCGCEDWEPLPLDPVFVGYLAGLVDGEGSLTLTRSQNCYMPRLSIGMTDDALLSVYKEAGVGYLYHRKAQRKGWKGVLVWSVTAGGLRRLLPTLRPHLRFKGLQADCLLEYMRLPQHVSRTRPEMLIAYRERVREILATLHDLNRKGV
jgi:hypothetical protein